MQTILVCDDDKEIVDAIDIYLTGEGFHILKAYDGYDALKILETEHADLMIIDVMMPGLDGIRTTLKVRETSSIPIIILSAKSEDSDKILGLNIGADDYLSKPFNPLELVARVKSQLRRFLQLGGGSVTASVLRIGGIELDDDAKTVRLDGEAYFDVSHDARHPFVVETRELAIRVLGTAFNVRALAGDPFTEVVLERGAVRLETPGGDNLVRLHPNQRAVYDARMGDMEVAEINAPLYVTRRYNLVTMKGATITEIIAGIEKSYGVRIRIMSPDDGKRYDINYLRSNSLEEVVDIVEFMTGTHCEVIRNE